MARRPPDMRRRNYSSLCGITPKKVVFRTRGPAVAHPGHRKTPGSKPRDWSFLRGSFTSCVLKEKTLSTRLRLSGFFPTRLDNVIPLVNSTMEARLLRQTRTRSCHISKVYPCTRVLSEPTRAKSRERYLYGKVCVSI